MIAVPLSFFTRGRLNAARRQGISSPHAPGRTFRLIPAVPFQPMENLSVPVKKRTLPFHSFDILSQHQKSVNA